MKKLTYIAIAFFISSCSTFESRQPANIGQCAFSERNKPLFNVLENDSEKIVVQLNNFIETFDLSSKSYEVKVTFEDTSTKDYKYFKRPTIIDIKSESVSREPYNISIPVTKSGLYYFELSEDGGKSFWKQKIFAVNSQENSITADEKAQLAQQYAPILEMTPEERFYPTSLEYIFNQVEPNSNLADEPFYITNKKAQSGFFGVFSKQFKFEAHFPFRDAYKVLPYYGHSESVLKSGLQDDTKTFLKTRTGKNNLTVYYSIFENKLEKEIYINYHFLYAYDTKNGTKDKDALAAHIFDRESLTVVLRSTSKQPLYAFYGAHLPNQLMAQLDSNQKIVQSWLTGRVFVNWPDTIKENNRLKAVAALGSHGIYPVKGLYAVMLNENIKLLLEPAGGGEKLYPENDSTPAPLKYKLKPLELEKVTSNCKDPMNILAYSGSTVDVLGPQNATFPPFTDREADYKNYLDPNAPLFDMKKALNTK